MPLAALDGGSYIRRIESHTCDVASGASTTWVKRFTRLTGTCCVWLQQMVDEVES